ncbi:unnamed protein product [Boreogadus saida]
MSKQPKLSRPPCSTSVDPLLKTSALDKYYVYDLNRGHDSTRVFEVDATSVVDWYRPGKVETRQAAHNALSGRAERLHGYRSLCPQHSYSFALRDQVVQQPPG